jgi:hypothetical protein
VPRQDHGRPIGEEKVPGDADSRLLDRRDLGKESVGVDDDSGTDDRRRPADHSRGKKVERKMPVAELDGVSGVVASVVAGHDLESVGEEVDDLPLALVSVLPPQDRRDFHGGKVSAHC